MEPIWVVLLEVVAFIDSAPTKGKVGFINAVLSAKDAACAESSVRKVLAGYEWQILGVRDISRVDPNNVYSEEISEIIDDVLKNPQYVRLATLHSYKPN